MGGRSQDAIPGLLTLARSETQPQGTRTAAISALGSIAEDYAKVQTFGYAPLLTETVFEMVNLLKDKNASVRVDAARLLERLPDHAKVGIPELIEMLAFSALPDEAGTSMEGLQRVHHATASAFG